MKRHLVLFSLLLPACLAKTPGSSDTSSVDTSVIDDRDLHSEPDDTAPVVDVPVTTDLVTPPIDTSDTNDTTVGPDVEPPADVVVPDDVGEPPSVYKLELGSWTMAPGEETTRCVVMRLGNVNPIKVDRMTTTLGKGSHHFIVYRSSDTVERTTPFVCTPFTQTLQGTTVPLMISQTRNETLELPEGVAFELEANQMIRLEAHYLNYFPEPIETSGTITLDVAPDTDDIVADFMFYGNINLSIPAGQSVTTPWKYLTVPSGLKVFGLTGHTHALGTNVEIEQTSDNSTAGQSVYPPADAPFDWAEAPIAHFSPPLAFNGDGFRFRCSWTNTTDQDVRFGESANKEMCFFWAYYYPSQGFLLKF